LATLPPAAHFLRVEISRKLPPAPVSVKEVPCFRLTKRRAASAYVMRGLDPRIHDEIRRALKVIMDCRVKPGNDEVGDIASCKRDGRDKPGHDDL